MARNLFYVINCKKHRLTRHDTGWAVLDRTNPNSGHFIQWCGTYAEARREAERRNTESRPPFGYARVVSHRGHGSGTLPERFRFSGGTGAAAAVASVARRLRLDEVCRHDSGRNSEGERYYEATFGRRCKGGGYTPEAVVMLVIERT